MQVISLILAFLIFNCYFLIVIFPKKKEWEEAYHMHSTPTPSICRCSAEEYVRTLPFFRGLMCQRQRPYSLNIPVATNANLIFYIYLIGRKTVGISFIKYTYCYLKKTGRADITITLLIVIFPDNHTLEVVYLL